MWSNRELSLSAVIGVLITALYFSHGSPRTERLALEGELEHAAADVCKHHQHLDVKTSSVTCPAQPPTLDIGPDWDPASDRDFRDLSYKRLRGAIQIPTESHDDMPMNASDPRFDVFYDIEAYLRDTFPLFHTSLSLEHVNEHGLLFTWAGVNTELKPVILMAHQDVVPVNPSTLHQWVHPPYSGHLDGEGWVWGRGTTDMKSTLVSLMAATEKLLQEGFQPERTVLFSHGFDEEIGGPRGAKQLAEVIMERYGKDGVSLIVDEGFTGVDNEFGQSFARVGVAEKGCLTVSLTVDTEGGHSSRPLKHTGIGIMSKILVEMESHPNQPKIKEGNPLLTYLECAAEYGDMDQRLRSMIRRTECWPVLAEEFGEDRVLSTFLKTTQAVDVINGGIKYNALPESVRSLTNYRIDFFETTQDTIDRLVQVINPIASSFNMTFSVFGDRSDVEQNVIKLDTFGIVLEPAPLTPVVGHAWDLIGGTLKQQFPGTVVVPSGMTAFTDTQYYWQVSPHIYRFVPASLEHVLNYHTVNERIHMTAHLSTIRFFYKLLQNLKGWPSA